MPSLQSLISKPCLEVAENPTKLAKTLDYPTPDHVKEWWNLVDEHDRLLLEASRRHFKSRSISVLYILHRIVKDPDINIILASETIGQAQKWLREIRQLIEQSPHLNHLYPDKKEMIKWSDSEIIVKRESHSGDPTVMCAGVGKSILGAGADLIVCDDIVSLENSKTKHRRNKLREWFFNILTPMVEPGGSIVVVCTPWDEDDIYHELMDNPSYRYHSYPSESDYEWGGVLWPGWWPEERLEARKKEVGSITYARQWLLDLKRIEGGLINSDWLKFYGQRPPGHYEWVIGVDPSIGESETSDYTGIVVTARHRESGIVYVESIDVGRWEARKRINKIEHMYDLYDESKILIEKTSMSMDFIEMLNKDTMLPVKPIKPGGRDKVARLEVYLPRIETGKIQFNNNLKSSLLIDQLIEFPEGSYDDLVDAFVYSCMGHSKRSKPSVRSVSTPFSSEGVRRI